MYVRINREFKYNLYQITWNNINLLLFSYYVTNSYSYSIVELPCA